MEKTEIKHQFISASKNNTNEYYLTYNFISNTSSNLKKKFHGPTKKYLQIYLSS
jgi:hypothetical protein